MLVNGIGLGPTFQQSILSGQNRLSKSVHIDFMLNHEPVFATPYSTGEQYKFSRTSSRWLQVYDTGSGSLVWREIGSNVVPITGFYYADLNSDGSPYDANGDLIPSAMRKGFHYGPEATNTIPDSRDYSTANWTRSNITVAQDAVGFDGVANNGSTITDSSSTQVGTLRFDTTVSDDSNTHSAVWLVKKDEDETRFPAVFLNLSGTGTIRSHFHFNTRTGEITDVASFGTASREIIDLGDRWAVVATVTNDSAGNTTLSSRLQPAAATTAGTTDAAATGSIVLQNAELRLNTSFYDEIPITTSGSAATRLADDGYKLAVENHAQAQGTVLLDLVAGVDETALASGSYGLVSVNSGAAASVLYSSDTDFKSSDGTNVNQASNPAWSKGDSVEAASRWSGSAAQVLVDGTAGTEGSYDGGFTISGSDILLFLNQDYPWHLKSLRYYQRDRRTAWIQGQQA